jgi:hypothetical protein
VSILITLERSSFFWRYQKWPEPEIYQSFILNCNTHYKNKVINFIQKRKKLKVSRTMVIGKKLANQVVILFFNISGYKTIRVFSIDFFLAKKI